MERVATLIEKLRELLQQGASTDKLILTTQMLQAELQKKKLPGAINGSSKVSVIMPLSLKLDYYYDPVEQSQQQTIPSQNEIPVVTKAEKIIVETPVVEQPGKEEERTVEVLQVDEEEIAAELDQMKRNAEVMNQLSVHNNVTHTNPVDFDHFDDIPTLAHQRYQQEEPVKAKEINESAATAPVSLNDRLKESRIELGEKLVESPIRDLRKAIGINDRFLYINELFRGDEAMYERSIKTINNFSILPEAEYWIQRELKVKIGWSEQHEVVKQFDQLVRRRFS